MAAASARGCAVMLMAAAAFGHGQAVVAQAAPTGVAATAPTADDLRSAQRARAKQELADGAQAATPRAADGRPDLTGIWVVPGGSYMTGTKTDKNVSLNFGKYVGGRQPMPANGPKYRPEFVKQVDYNDINEPKVDKVFNCGRAGVPRIGVPQQIVQTPQQIVLLYVDVAGETFRVVPLDGRTFRADVDASYNGDSIGHWDGDTLVVDTRNFVDETWFGERGYLHTDRMTVQERIRREGNSLTWQATIIDPGVLTEPWTTPPRTYVLSQVALEEPPPCNDIVAEHLVNTDNHGQR